MLLYYPLSWYTFCYLKKYSFLSPASTVLTGNITAEILHVFGIDVFPLCNQASALSWSMLQRMANKNQKVLWTKAVKWDSTESREVFLLSSTVVYRSGFSYSFYFHSGPRVNSSFDASPLPVLPGYDLWGHGNRNSFRILWRLSSISIMWRKSVSHRSALLGHPMLYAQMSS